MLSKCGQCEFNIRQTDEFCFNCGNSYLSENIPFSQKYKAGLISFLISFSLILIIALFFSKNITIELVFLIIILSISFTLFISLTVEPLFRGINDSKSEKKYFQYTLNAKNQTIKKRIEELSTRHQNINKVLEKIGENPSKTLQNVQQKLISAREIVDFQLERYELQKRKIELVKLQNAVVPYLENVQFLDEKQTENGITISEQTKAKLNLLKESFSSNFSKQAYNEKESFIKQLKETSDNCEKLREVLLSKEALQAIQSIEHGEDINFSKQMNEIAHFTETFNIQTTLTDFSESFEQLETEYQRLLADKEITQNLLDS